jgi:NADPH2:quinone reductase
MKAELDVGKVMRRRLTITGSTLRGRSVAFKAAIAEKLYKHVWPLFAGKRLRPIIHDVFPAQEAVRAHALMESSAHIGKILLRW